MVKMSEEVRRVKEKDKKKANDSKFVYVKSKDETLDDLPPDIKRGQQLREFIKETCDKEIGFVEYILDKYAIFRDDLTAQQKVVELLNCSKEDLQIRAEMKKEGASEAFDSKNFKDDTKETAYDKLIARVSSLDAIYKIDNLMCAANAAQNYLANLKTDPGMPFSNRFLHVSLLLSALTDARLVMQQLQNGEKQ
jgi:hypothetical protein